MMDILYSHARDAEGSRRSVREVEAPPPFRCGDCDNGMIARRGQIRRWHFAHKAKVECVPNPDPDNMLHRVAQDLIVKSFNERLKHSEPYEIVYTCVGGHGRLLDGGFYPGGSTACENTFKENVAHPGATIQDEQIVVSGTRSDIVLELPGREPFIIEVVNTHDLEEETRRRYKESGCRVVIRKVTWEDVEDLASECRVDGSLNIADWKCADCSEWDLAQQRREAEEREQEKQRVDTLNRRKEIVDAVAAKLVRRRQPKPTFRPWYEVYKKNWEIVSKPVKMFPRVQRTVFANAVILTEMGFEQHNRNKPHLFRFRIRRDPKVFIYGDLGGSDVVPMYEDPSVMLYAPDLGGDPGLEEYAVKVFGRKLQEAGASVRVGIEAHMAFESRYIDPTKHVDMKLVNSMVSEEPVREMEAQRQEHQRQKGEQRLRQEEEMREGAGRREKRVRELREGEERDRTGQHEQEARWWAKFNEWVKRGGGVS